MFRNTVVAFALAHCLSASAVSLDKRIVGGDKAKDGDIPYILSVHNFMSGHTCGGVLLDSTTAITAAHCAGGSSTSVRAGTLNHNEGFRSEIVWQQIHPYYVDNKVDEDPPYQPNDIAIIKLSPPINETETIKYAKLPAKGSESKPGSMVIAAGWGTTSGRLGDATPLELHKITVPIVSRSECRKQAPGLGDRDTVVCAGTTGKGVCKHDSGGPLFDQATGQVVGVASWVIRPSGVEGENPVICAKAPAVFSRVASYVDFIQKYLEPWQPDLAGEAQKIHEEMLGELCSLPGYGKACLDASKSCPRYGLKTDPSDVQECIEHTMACRDYPAPKQNQCMQKAKKCLADRRAYLGEMDKLVKCLKE